jgi:glycosyltransferase involved in cell wall biosynthesis
MPHEELADFYRSVDLIITPSHFETFGNVPLEAITTGTPAIVNRTVGVKEALEKVGLEDFVVDINNMDSVVKKIKSIKDKRIIVDKETSNKIIERYNWESVMGEYFEVLRKCLENQQASITAT